MKQILLLPVAIGTLLDPADVCPRFACESVHNGINMDQQVFCYKHEVDNPFLIKLKPCLEGQFCHAQLNRCAMDPYAQVVNREPGAICTQHFECKSKYCSMQRGVCSVQPNQELSCQVDSDCDVGMFCANQKFLQEKMF